MIREGEKLDFSIPGFTHKQIKGINRGDKIDFMVMERDVMGSAGYNRAECSLTRDEVADFIRVLYDLWEKME